LPLLRKADLKDQYSSSDKELENNLKKIDDDLIDDDLLSDLDLGVEVETVDDLMAALDASDDPPDDIASVVAAPVADWLIDVRQLARKHGPFAPWQILEVIRALSESGDEPSQ
jgi:hypothetical protein